ncbi:MAG: patatin-like phospholipase family protein [Gammaproteobacteria bacterium]|nr:patatin-like phospholipase family protein [Gammaproteobacteria bacterium]
MFWFSRSKPEYEPVTGLVLPGGGARNAYQVGVLRAVADILPPENDNPFPVITGTSSGAINATLLASTAGEFRNGIERLAGVWENFESSMVFYADNWSALRSASNWALTLLSAGFATGHPKSVLDNQPLRELLESHIRFARIQHAIDRGDLRALGVTSSGYDTGMSTCYYQGDQAIDPWRRTHRCGVPVELRIDHLMASIAIPLIFPSVKVNGEYHGDGTMRETAPLSPALHLGANRLLIIGVQDESHSSDEDPEYPSIGQISGYVLDTLFMDRLNADIERLNRINLTIAETGVQSVELEGKTLKPVEFLVISPSMDLSEIVAKYMKRAPTSVRALLRGMGALNRAGRPLISYLLFEGAFCHELIELGYEDGMRQRDAISQLLIPSAS